MVLVDWILPILIGIVASLLLLSILFKDPENIKKIKNTFKNITSGISKID